MGMINYVNSLYKVNLKDFYLIGCQHYLKSNQKMVFSLIEKGLPPKNIFMINKSYSYNKEVEEGFKKKGINCFNYRYNSHVSFDKQFRRAIKRFLKSIKKRTNPQKRIIIIDDGGELINIANKMLKRKTYAVEQTSSGFHKLKDKRLNFPVVNIARSEAKLNHETPYIIRDFLKKLYSKLKKETFNPKKTLIIGKGILGKELAKKIKFKTDFYDILENKERLSKILPNYDLIIGATGSTSIQHKLHKKLKKDVFLVSISSSDREFDAVYLRRKLKRKTSIHEDLLIKEIYLLNNGFPLSFQGNKEESPHKYMQLTRALMLAGIYESLNQKKGLIQLKKEIQDKIINKFKSINK